MDLDGPTNPRSNVNPRGGGGGGGGRPGGVEVNPMGQSAMVDEEFDEALSQVEKYRDVLDKNKEQEQIITFQKAKIEAMESEIDKLLKELNEKEMGEESNEKNEKVHQEEVLRLKT